MMPRVFVFRRLKFTANKFGWATVKSGMKRRNAMIGFKALAAGIAVAAGCVAIADAETLTIATVNNDDMIIMQKLSSKWEQQTGNKINWVILEENVLRQKVTTDSHQGRPIRRNYDWRL